MNNWFKLFLFSALLGFVKAHYFIRAVILAGLGLAGLWMLHTLAQDFNSIQNNINAGVIGNTESGGVAGYIRSLSKRSAEQKKYGKLIDWESVLSRDPARCTRSFLCQLAATEEEYLSRDERLMLELARHSVTEDTSASKHLKDSLRIGEKVEEPRQCMSIYKLCPYTSQMMMTLLKLFGK